MPTLCNTATHISAICCPNGRNETNGTQTVNKHSNYSNNINVCCAYIVFSSFIDLWLCVCVISSVHCNISAFLFCRFCKRFHSFRRSLCVWLLVDSGPATLLPLGNGGIGKKAINATAHTHTQKVRVEELTVIKMSMFAYISLSMKIAVRCAMNTAAFGMFGAWN